MKRKWVKMRTKYFHCQECDMIVRHILEGDQYICQNCSHKSPCYFNYSHYIKTEDEANRLLEGLLKRKKLRQGWTSNDGTKTHPWVVRGIKES